MEQTIPGINEYYQELFEHCNIMRIMSDFIRKARPKRKVRGWKNKEKRRLIYEQIKSERNQ